VYSVFKELDDPDRFKRMEKSIFEELVRLVGPGIQKKTFYFVAHVINLSKNLCTSPRDK
jgi:hypothetical protein